jgi:hypothetical protein
MESGLRVMNTSQKILTIIAVAVFALLTVILPSADPDQWGWERGRSKREPRMNIITFEWAGERYQSGGVSLSPLPFKLLSVSMIYAGLFFILKSRPNDFTTL